MNESQARLPREPADFFTKPFARFLQIETASAGALLAVTLCAVILANSPWSTPFLDFWQMPLGVSIGYIEFTRSLQHWVNDALMTLFFFIVALELKREMVVGELRNPRMAALSLAAALGGMIVPATLYYILARGTQGAHGWGTVMATDTAFVIGCLAVLGARIPLSLRLFLLSLAIFDDIGAILVVAIGYGETLNWQALGLTAAGIALVPAMTWMGIRSIPVYFIVGGLIWLALDASGIHPTLAGVILGLLTPARGWVSDSRLHAILHRVVAHPPSKDWSGDTSDRHDLQRANIATREAFSPVERLEILLHPWVAFIIMPLFALANAGIPISLEKLDTALASAIIAGLVVGKPVGVVLFSFLAVKLHLAQRPPDMNWGLLVGGGLLTGIGFTMSLFIAGLAYGPALLNSAKIGILVASSLAGICGLLLLLWQTRHFSLHVKG
ncbi:Na+/H+ antiporter NhaA [Ferrovibrio sp.]|uniref:Na+/H+ antiporter NhaA n=1 Tax=Ferrovibrio sp. TaxID=1917215 RepID=UPI001B471A64|nr:Na+/H+ antiporter NhaA [Ferrovibrio sp.]MBP7063145.1 Na+/H+ antiporter NhaA [Ferrovibrio sp.]